MSATAHLLTEARAIRVRIDAIRRLISARPGTDECDDLLGAIDAMAAVIDTSRAGRWVAHLHGVAQ